MDGMWISSPPVVADVSAPCAAGDSRESFDRYQTIVWVSATTPGIRYLPWESCATSRADSRRFLQRIVISPGGPTSLRCSGTEASSRPLPEDVKRRQEGRAAYAAAVHALFPEWPVQETSWSPSNIIRLSTPPRRNADHVCIPRPAPGIDRFFHSLLRQRNIVLLSRLAGFMAEKQLNIFERSAALKHLNGKRVTPFVSALSFDAGLDVKL